MTSQAATRKENLRASVWLIADMSLNVWALSIVKAVGLDYTATQLVFIRAIVGFVLLVPWAYRERSAFLNLDHLSLHAARIVLSAATLAASFFAIARVPLALFSAINFTRPILLMIMAALLLGEHITRSRWTAASIGLFGAIIAVNPAAIQAGGDGMALGLAALTLTVTMGTLAIIITRRLKGTPAVIMMVFYTGGLALFTAPFAAVNWVPVETRHWPLLVAIGLFAQAAQFCFLKAHWLGDTGVLGPVSYLSLILSTAAGFIFFAELPSLPLVIGAAVILLSAWYIGSTA
ncbi:MAG: DMT family transporter [Pseudomonadota bacterium]